MSQRTRELARVFDAHWYLDQNPDVRASGIDPWRHFVRRGLGEHRDPGPWFDSAWYLERYPDVAASGTPPLRHYVSHGVDEGRFPNARWESAGAWPNGTLPTRTTLPQAIADSADDWAHGPLGPHLLNRAGLTWAAQLTAHLERGA